MPDDIGQIKQNQKQEEHFFSEYLEANRHNLDEFFKRINEQCKAYIIGHIELLQSQMDSSNR